jgi:DNA-binding transcriptional ArsR family regulator
MALGRGHRSPSKDRWYDWGDADVGIINTGGVRDDFDAGADITRRDVLSMLPFANFVILVELTGEQLARQLENNFIDDERDLFYHVAGARKLVDPEQPAGERAWHLEVGGEPIDPDGTYTVATIDFLLGRGEAYDVLHEGEMLVDAQAGPLLSEEVMNYVEEAGVVDARVDGRIAFGPATPLEPEKTVRFAETPGRVTAGRTVPVRFTIEDADGEPVSGADVSVEVTRPDGTVEEAPHRELVDGRHRALARTSRHQPGAYYVTVLDAGQAIGELVLEAHPRR